MAEVPPKKASAIQVKEVKAPEMQVKEVKAPEMQVKEVKAPEMQVKEVKAPEKQVKEESTPQHMHVLPSHAPHKDKAHEENRQQGKEGKKEAKMKTTFVEKVQEFCTRADMFATAHVWPIHILCIVIAAAIIPISAIAVIWDLLSANVFEIPDLSTINTPAFVLFINFIAMPLAMYGYMMEYLMHEHSKLAIIALICVVVHPILFIIRALIEYAFDGFRGEEKIYFEGFDREGQEQKYPIGAVRYRRGDPFSDSEEGKTAIKEIFGDEIFEN